MELVKLGLGSRVAKKLLPARPPRVVPVRREVRGRRERHEVSFGATVSI